MLGRGMCNLRCGESVTRPGNIWARRGCLFSWCWWSARQAPDRRVMHPDRRALPPPPSGLAQFGYPEHRSGNHKLSPAPLVRVRPSSRIE